MELSAAPAGSLPLTFPLRRRSLASSSSLLLLSRPIPTAPASLSASGLGRGAARPIRTAATRGEDWSSSIVSDDSASRPTKASLLVEPPPPEKKVEEPSFASDGSVGGPNGGENTQDGEDLLSKFNALIESDNAYIIALYGSGALVALWISSVIISALDSVPLFPKLMEIVGLGFTIWFSSRYLIFKKDRDELFAKVEELKDQILGSSDD